MAHRQPWRLTTELRHRWLVVERRCSGSGWNMHDGDHATLHDACAYVEPTSGHDLTTHDAHPRQPIEGVEKVSSVSWLDGRLAVASGGAGWFSVDGG
jgi:hypothetical protein